MKLKSILALLLALGLLLAGCKTKSEPAASEKPSTVPSKTDAATGETTSKPRSTASPSPTSPRAASRRTT